MNKPKQIAIAFGLLAIGAVSGGVGALTFEGQIKDGLDTSRRALVESLGGTNPVPMIMGNGDFMGNPFIRTTDVELFLNPGAEIPFEAGQDGTYLMYKNGRLLVESDLSSTHPTVLANLGEGEGIVAGDLFGIVGDCRRLTFEKIHMKGIPGRETAIVQLNILCPSGERK